MALTEQQDIPKKPEVREPWTFRRLFPFAGAISAIAKVFVSPFDILLGFLVFIIGISELFGRHLSWFFWLFTVLILVVDLMEKNNYFLESPEDIEEEK